VLPLWDSPAAETWHRLPFQSHYPDTGLTSPGTRELLVHVPTFNNVALSWQGIDIIRVPTGQGKVREICFFFKVRENLKSGNFANWSGKKENLKKSGNFKNIIC